MIEVPHLQTPYLAEFVGERTVDDYRLNRLVERETLHRHRYTAACHIELVEIVHLVNGSKMSSQRPTILTELVRKDLCQFGSASEGACNCLQVVGAHV